MFGVYIQVQIKCFFDVFSSPLLADFFGDILLALS